MSPSQRFANPQLLVAVEGLEPPCLAALVSKTSVSASSTTRPLFGAPEENRTLLQVIDNHLAPPGASEGMFGQGGRIRTCVYRVPSSDDGQTFVTP